MERKKIMRKKRRKKEKKVKNLSKKDGKLITNELLSESIYKIDEKIIDGHRIITKVMS